MHNNDFNRLFGKNSSITPNEAKKAVENGNADSLINNLSDEDKQRLNQILNDPKELEKALNSPQAKALMELFNL